MSCGQNCKWEIISGLWKSALKTASDRPPAQRGLTGRLVTDKSVSDSTLEEEGLQYVVVESKPHRSI
jgi:hypothetical protein